MYIAVFSRVFRVHRNGPFFWDFVTFLPIEMVHREWKAWQDLAEDINPDFADGHETLREFIDARIKIVGVSPLWIPIFTVGNGDACCLDLEPTPLGKYGQLIRVAHDEESRTVLAEGFSDFLYQYLKALQHEKR